MQRVGFSLKINPELKEGYKKAHDEIWPELVEAMKTRGVKNYSIFFKKDGTIFAYLESEKDFEKISAEIAELDVSKR
jgi:L-rhamnose mutarotase